MDALRAIGLTEAQIMASLLVLARIGPLFALAPVFGSKLIPARVRALAAVSLSFCLAPVVAGDARVPRDVLSLGMAIGSEVVVGLAYAFCVALLFQAVAVAGSFLDTLIGFSYGSLVDPVSGTQSSVLMNTYSLFAAVIFLAIGGDRWVIEGVTWTFREIPAGAPADLQDIAEGVRMVFSGIFLSALQIAAPVVVALLLTDVALGIITRAVPQLQVMSVGFAFKIGVGILVMIASLPFAGGWIGDQVQQSVRDALRVVGAG